MNNIVKLFTGQRDPQQKFNTLLRPHIELMYRMAFRWTRNQGDAEDLVQEVLTKLASRVDEMSAVEALRPWLIKIIYRQYVDLYRRQVRSPVVLQEDLTDAANSDGNFEIASETDEAAQISLQEVLNKALHELSPEQRDVVLLHDMEGHSATEVAEILEISIGTVKSRLHRSREKLKNILGDGTF